MDESRMRALCAVVALLGALACRGATAPSPAPSPTPTAAVTISPALLHASVNDPWGLSGRYVINPSVTFYAAGTEAVTVKDVTFAFIVADRVIKQGVFLVHGGDLRDGPVTQRYPLTLDVPVHFPDLHMRIAATFVAGSGANITTASAQAPIQIPGADP